MERRGFFPAYLFLFFLSLFLAVFLMALGAGPARAAGWTSVVLASGASHEDCEEVRPGQSLHYSYVSNKPVAFRIHYHAQGKTIVVFRKNPLEKYSGKFTPEVKRKYCLMWFNTNYPAVTLRYRKSITGG